MMLPALSSEKCMLESRRACLSFTATKARTEPAFRLTKLSRHYLRSASSGIATYWALSQTSPRRPRNFFSTSLLLASRARVCLAVFRQGA